MVIMDSIQQKFAELNTLIRLKNAETCDEALNQLQTDFNMTLEHDAKKVSRMELSQISIKQISSVDLIPDTPLYQLESGEFAFKLCGVVFRGSKANIVRAEAGTVPGLMPCKRGIDCKQARNGHCRFWHPPEERLANSSENNNLTPGSFIHAVKRSDRLKTADGSRWGVDVTARQNMRLIMHEILSYLQNNQV